MFGKGLYRYTFVETCVEDKELFLKDGTSKIFYNTTAKAKEIPKDIRYLFDISMTESPGINLRMR